MLTLEVESMHFTKKPDVDKPAKGALKLVDDVLQHEQALKAFIRRSVDQESDTDDIFQQLIERFLKLDVSTEIDNPLSYAYKIAQNLIIDFKRVRQKTPEELTFEPESQCLSLEDRIAYEQRIAIYQSVLEKMPVLRRKVFIQRRLHGKSRVEIGSELGISEEAVKKHISRALDDLEREIKRNLSFKVVENDSPLSLSTSRDV